jgi:type IX secretion system PorP/SprF family membrane protein
LKIFTPLIFSCLFVLSQSLGAQDIHFSMFYSSPLTLNPALTGAGYDGTFRAAAIYRNQWMSISTPFNTFAASFDIKLLQDKLKNDIFGIGGLIQTDQSGDGKLTSTSAMLSAAFHKGLDKGHKHFIGLGAQFAYTQNSLKWQQLAFPDQFSGTDFNIGMSNGENFAKSTLNYFDMNMGILEQSTFTPIVSNMIGFSVFHLAEPNESFLGKVVRLSDRFVVHDGLRIKAAKNFYICPNFIFMYQDKAQEINLGSSFEYHIPGAKTETVLSIGGWSRIGDAAIITGGVEYYKVRLMAAYDINYSQLKPATNGRGAFEISIVYTGIIKQKSLNYPILVPCPMM